MRKCGSGLSFKHAVGVCVNGGLLTREKTEENVKRHMTVPGKENKETLVPVQATKSLSELEKAIAEARKQCDEATAGECAAAWDTVEELSAAIAHKKAAVSCDPLALAIPRCINNYLQAQQL